MNSKTKGKVVFLKRSFRSVLALLLTLALLLSALPAAISLENPAGEAVLASPFEPVKDLPAGSGQEPVTPADPELPDVPEPETILPEMKRSDTGYIWMEHVGGTELTDAYLAAQAAGTAEPQDDLPAFYSSKDKGWVTPVRNQNPYGSCWAHAPLASIESYMIKHGIVNGATGSAANTGINLSETHLAWYAYTYAYDKLDMLYPDMTTPYDNYMNNGGNGYFAAYTLMRGEGPASETVSALAYNNVPTGGFGDTYALDYNVTQVRDVELIPMSNRDAVKRAIMEYGAGDVSYCHEDAYCNYSTGAYCRISDDTVTNHAVTVVGWNDNYEASKFNSVSRPNSNGAWIIKGSWGTGLGDSGYFYISYEDSACAASDCFFYRVDSGDDFDKIYQHDGTTYPGYLRWYSGYPVAAMFQTGYDRYEELRSVAICALDENLNYNLKIYVDCEEGKPTSGTLALEQDGSFAHGGFHQVLLNQTVVIHQAKNYSVVFKLTGSTVSVPIDDSGSSEGYVTWNHEQRYKSSFLYMGSTLGWASAGTKDLRIKAYTKQHDHEIVETVVEPTCTEGGSTTDTCWCGYEFTYYQPPYGHDYSEYLGYREPTCTNPGGDIYMCWRCLDYIFDPEIPALGHDYVGVVTPPTCIELGYTTYTCNRCGDSYVGDYSDDYGPHEYEECERVLPGCTTPGYIKYECAVCHDTVQSTLPALGHDFYAFDTVEPTCTEQGYTLYWCMRCDYHYKGDYVDALGHSFEVAIREPDCTSAGVYYYHCTVCGYSYEESFGAPYGHDYFPLQVIEPTCTEQGWTEFKCGYCGIVVVGSYTDPLGHDYIASAVPPSCTEPGYTTYTCTRCNDSYTGDNVPAAGHHFVDGFCTVCGAEDPDYVPPLVNPFVDVTPGKYFYDAVLWALYHDPQVTNGTDDTHFTPNKNCTRGQVVTFLWRAAGCPEPTITTHPFTDVKSSAYYYKAMLWAVENGITAGTSATTFGPNKDCNRAQVVTFLWRAAGEPEPETTVNPFTDVKTTASYYKAVLWAVENEITTGTSATTFTPTKTCTRGQVVTFLYRAYQE